MENESITPLVISQHRKTIKRNEFSCREDLISIKMPDSVIVIGEGAFFGCRNLKKVEFSKGLKTLEASAFKDCYELESITLPEGLETICDSAFMKCFKLESVVIPKSVRTIGEDAFGMCRGLKHIKIPLETFVSSNAFRENYQDIDREYY